MQNIPATRSENVFQVLADRARDRSSGELGGTAIACGVNALFIWWRYPGISWLASGLTACAAYAIWGLLDRLSSESEARSFFGRSRAGLLRDVQPIVAILGTGAALWALGGFMAAALRGWQH